MTKRTNREGSDIKAYVEEQVQEALTGQAQHLCRSVRQHTGQILTAWAQVPDELLSAADHLIRHPADLCALIRRHHETPAKHPQRKGPLGIKNDSSK